MYGPRVQGLGLRGQFAAGFSGLQAFFFLVCVCVCCFNSFQNLGLFRSLGVASMPNRLEVQLVTMFSIIALLDYPAIYIIPTNCTIRTVTYSATAVETAATTSGLFNLHF